ncbi:Uncharacterised protein [Klebsiella pneumoniae]|nr:Uncharacterised protein [Klebsiella pneumoniae]SLZ05202.1 Uncharacterised protein [Klebsiella pneumoniae]
MGPVMSTLPVPPPKLVEVPETEPENCRSGRLVMTLINPPGSRIPYSVEAGPFRTSTRSVAALKLRGSTVRRPLVMIEPSRLAPKPRRVKASWVPPRVLVCTTLATLYSASSSEVAC